MWQQFMAVGNLGQDPEVKASQAGNQFCTLNVACNDKWKDKDGQWQERVEWLRVICFGATAENCGRYLSKGSKVLIQGRLQTRDWTDKEGVKRWTTEIVANVVKFLDPKSGGQSSERRPEPAADEHDDDRFPFS